MGTITSRIVSHPLTTFFVASVGLGWLVTLGVAQLSSNPVLLPLIAIPVSFVPALIAWVVLHVTGSTSDRQAWRHRVMRLRVGWRWYAAALVVLPLVHFAGVAIATLAGGTFPFHPALFALLPLFLVTNFGEEIGWRGYGLPKLQERMSPLGAALVLGSVWGAFHWVALAGNTDAPFAYLAVSTIQLVAVSVIMTYVFNGSGQSVPVVAVMHAMYDTASIGVTPLVETTVPLMAFSLTAVVAWLVVLGLVAVKGTSLGGVPLRPQVASAV